MSDYSPNPNDYDKYGNTRYDPPEPGGRGPYVLLGILVAIGLVGGLLYFNGTPRDNADVARAPAERPPVTDTMRPGAPADTPTVPAPGAAPIDRTTPSPATPQ